MIQGEPRAHAEETAKTIEVGGSEKKPIVLSLSCGQATDPVHLNERSVGYHNGKPFGRANLHKETVVLDHGLLAVLNLLTKSPMPVRHK
jgi:hypothetical protein